MNSIKQPVIFHCKACHIAWQVFHSLSEPYYCDECSAILYRPSVIKEQVFTHTTAKPDKVTSFK